MNVWSWRQAILQADLPSTTKLVLCVISTFMNDHGGGCYPSQSQIAKLSSLTERAVIKHLKLAADAGWLTIKKRNQKGQEWASNEYEASMVQGVNDVHPSEDEGVNQVHVRGEPRSGEGVNEVHTNSPLELSKELSIREKPKKKRNKYNYTEEFEQFWKSYPAYRRKNKTDAFDEWKEATKIARPEEIHSGLQKYILTAEVGQGYTPHPERWLKKQRWCEEHIPAEEESIHELRQDKKYQDRMRCEQIKDDLKFGAYVSAADKEWYSKYRRGAS